MDSCLEEAGGFMTDSECTGDCENQCSGYQFCPLMMEQERCDVDGYDVEEWLCRTQKTESE